MRVGKACGHEVGTEIQRGTELTLTSGKPMPAVSDRNHMLEAAVCGCWFPSLTSQEMYATGLGLETHDRCVPAAHLNNEDGDMQHTHQSHISLQ